MVRDCGGNADWHSTPRAVGRKGRRVGPRGGELSVISHQLSVVSCQFSVRSEFPKVQQCIAVGAQLKPTRSGSQCWRCGLAGAGGLPRARRTITVT